MTTKYFCIKCCPASELTQNHDGTFVCAYHGSNYIMETRELPDDVVPLVEEMAADVDPVAEMPMEVVAADEPRVAAEALSEVPSSDEA
jgi:hypothetical protein